MPEKSKAQLKIKPCPFCGSKDINILTKPDQGAVTIYCGLCSAEGADRDECETLQSVVDSWNERVGE